MPCIYQPEDKISYMPNLTNFGALKFFVSKQAPKILLAVADV
jgi:hypothetical protein